MAKIKYNPAIQEIQGQISNLVYKRGRGGQMLVTKRPDMSSVKWSPAQEQHRTRFKQAVAYARSAMLHPDVRPIYERMAAEQGKRPFDLAVSDYFKGNDLRPQR